jgi:hypothetical protein
MSKKVLIAIGDKAYTEIMKETLASYADDFSLSSQEVFSRRFLEEILDIEKPDILLIHDQYLGSDFSEQKDKDNELLTFIRNIRINYDDSLRVVLLCERTKGDPFLSQTVSMGVLDIFNNNSFDLDDFVEQLIDKPRFSRVEKFIVSATPVVVQPEVNNNPAAVEEKTEVVESVNQTNTPTKVIEKKIVQKVINKSVVKRDYNIQIHNHTEKVVGVPVRKKLIMIGSSAARSGSTFVSHLLARTLTKMGISTTYVESPFSTAYTFDRFTGHHFADDYRSKFYEFSKYIDPKKKSIFDWNKGDVDIICKHPTNEPVYEEDEVAFETFIKVLFSSPSTVTIIDVGTDWQYELFQDVFDIADHVYFVIEPDIPLIQYLEESKKESVAFLHKQISHAKSSLIGNRFDKSLLSNKLIKDLYNGEFKTSIPAFPVTDVFQAQYDGIFLSDYKDYHKRVETCLEPLLQEILPQEFLKKQKKGAGLFKGLFNKKITIEKSEINETEPKGEESTV